MISLLYVDDEPALLELGKLFLERSKNFTVDTAVSAAEAINEDCNPGTMTASSRIIRCLIWTGSRF